VGTDEEQLAVYLKEVRAEPLLPRSEELRLLPLAHAGDEAAKMRLIQGLLELTAILALRVAPDWLPPLDALQIGNIELIRAVEDASVEDLTLELPGRIQESIAQFE